MCKNVCVFTTAPQQFYSKNLAFCAAICMPSQGGTAWAVCPDHPLFPLCPQLQITTSQLNDFPPPNIRYRLQRRGHCRCRVAMSPSPHRPPRKYPENGTPAWFHYYSYPIVLGSLSLVFPAARRHLLATRFPAINLVIPLTGFLALNQLTYDHRGTPIVNILNMHDWSNDDEDGE